MSGEDKRFGSLSEALTDVTKLTDRELDTHIAQLRDVACRFSEGKLKAPGGTSFGIDAIIPLIQIAVTEKTSRLSTRLAKVAIGIALLGLFIAIVGIWQ